MELKFWELKSAKHFWQSRHYFLLQVARLTLD
jgi:hypothetical protein